MHASINYDPNSLTDIDEALAYLRRQRALIANTDRTTEARLEMLRLDCFRLLWLIKAHFGQNQCDLHQLAQASGEPVRELHGLTGALGRACKNRGIDLPYEKHGGSPEKISITDEFYALMQENEAEVLNAA